MTPPAVVGGGERRHDAAGGSETERAIICLLATGVSPSQWGISLYSSSSLSHYICSSLVIYKAVSSKGEAKAAIAARQAHAYQLKITHCTRRRMGLSAHCGRENSNVTSHSGISSFFAEQQASCLLFASRAYCTPLRGSDYFYRDAHNAEDALAPLAFHFWHLCLICAHSLLYPLSTI